MIAPTRASHTMYQNRMRAALTDLTITQRQALYLHVVEGWPIGYVAWQLRLTREEADGIAGAARFKLYEAVSSHA